MKHIIFYNRLIKQAYMMLLPPSFLLSCDHLLLKLAIFFLLLRFKCVSVRARARVCVQKVKKVTKVTLGLPDHQVTLASGAGTDLLAHQAYQYMVSVLFLLYTHATCYFFFFRALKVCEWFVNSPCL